MEREIICLSCPNGCHLSVRWSQRDDIEVVGGKCERGEPYAREEVFEPKRVVTAVVRTDSTETPFVPIKTDKPILKQLIRPVLESVYARQVRLPVQLGETLIDNFQDSGVNVVFTRSASA
jgi:CxxC motif-containing protein